MSRGTKRLLMLTLAVALSFVAGLNGLVRATGGNPHLLSVRYMPAKIAAVRSLVAHLPRHALGACDVSTQASLRRAARRQKIPAGFLSSLAKAESGSRRHSISRAGAMGVMQIVPGTATYLGLEDPFDVAANIDAGARYVGQLWRRYQGDRTRVAAAYNAGPGNVPRGGSLRLSGETKHYVAKVLQRR